MDNLDPKRERLALPATNEFPPWSVLRRTLSETSEAHMFQRSITWWFPSIASAWIAAAPELSQRLGSIISEFGDVNPRWAQAKKVARTEKLQPCCAPFEILLVFKKDTLNYRTGTLDVILTCHSFWFLPLPRRSRVGDQIFPQSLAWLSFASPWKSTKKETNAPAQTINHHNLTKTSHYYTLPEHCIASYCIIYHMHQT